MMLSHVKWIYTIIFHLNELDGCHLRILKKYKKRKKKTLKKKKKNEIQKNVIKRRNEKKLKLRKGV